MNFLGNGKKAANSDLLHSQWELLMRILWRAAVGKVLLNMQWGN